MLVAAELTLAGVPAMKIPDNWPGYDVIAQAAECEKAQIRVWENRRGEEGHQARQIGLLLGGNSGTDNRCPGFPCRQRAHEYVAGVQSAADESVERKVACLYYIVSGTHGGNFYKVGHDNRIAGDRVDSELACCGLVIRIVETMPHASTRKQMSPP
jgi:hypothetical protein